MTAKIESGFFTMDDVLAVEKINDVNVAKMYVIQRVNEMPTAKSFNIHKAKAAITKARSITELMFTISNFILAHPSEHLKVIK